MVLALYSYLGYYNICYVGEEVRDPGRTIPRAILLSAVLVCVLFAGLHLAMLGTVPWSEAVSGRKQWGDEYSLPADFMGRIHGPWAVRLLTVLLMDSCFGAAFAGLLGYPHPLRSGAGRPLLPGGRPRPPAAPYPARLAAARRRSDAVLELL